MKSLFLAVGGGLGVASAIAAFFTIDERNRMDAELQSWEEADRKWLEELFEQRRREFHQQLKKGGV